MAITSTDIQNQSFSIDRKGYDVDEVDVFLEHVASEIDEMNSTIEQLEGELDESKFSGFDTPAAVQQPAAEAVVSQEEIEVRDARIADLEQQLEDKKADDNAIAQALIIAQRSAEDIISRANADADQIRQDAEDEAQRILDKANNEKQRIVDEIEQLDEDREDTRLEYQDLLNDFISHASQKLNEIKGNAVNVTSAHARTSTDRDMPKNQAPIRKKEASVKAATYTTPQKNASSVVVPSTPRPTKVEKDLSGFGDADDDFELSDID